MLVGCWPRLTRLKTDKEKNRVFQQWAAHVFSIVEHFCHFITSSNVFTGCAKQSSSTSTYTYMHTHSQSTNIFANTNLQAKCSFKTNQQNHTYGRIYYVVVFQKKFMKIQTKKNINYCPRNASECAFVAHLGLLAKRKTNIATRKYTHAHKVKCQ